MRSLWLVMVVSATVMTGSAAAQTAPLSRPLALTGIVTMVGGIAMMAPYGEEYRFLGHPYCVSDREVARGPCEQPTAGVITAGKWVLAAGAVMTVVGLWRVHRVSVAPMVGPQGQGIAGTIRWGQ